MANPTREQDELAGPQGLAKRLNAGSNKVLTPSKAPTPLEAPIPPFVPPTEDFFMKFMKAFVESTQARDWEQAKPRKQLLKARFPETYLKKFHMDCYHFCQQYEDYFKTLDANEMNRIPFIASFFCGIINLR